MRFAAELRSVSDEVNARRKERAKEQVRSILNDLEPKFVAAAEKGLTHLELSLAPERPFVLKTKEAEEMLADLGYKNIVVKPSYLYVAW